MSAAWGVISLLAMVIGCLVLAVISLYLFLLITIRIMAYFMGDDREEEEEDE